MKVGLITHLAAAARPALLAVAMLGVPALAAQAPEDDAATVQAERPLVTDVKFKEAKNVLVVIGKGFDAEAIVRLNGVEVEGERKFFADQGRLRIKLPADTPVALKAAGENRLEVVANGLSSGEFGF